MNYLDVIEQIGSRKANVTEEMAKKAKKTARKQNKLIKILSRFGGFIKSIFKKKVPVLSYDTEKDKFDELLSKLQDENISEMERERIIFDARNIIERTSSAYDDVLSDMSYTDEQKDEVYKNKQRILAELEAKLDKAMEIKPKTNVLEGTIFKPRKIQNEEEKMPEINVPEVEVPVSETTEVEKQIENEVEEAKPSEKEEYVPELPAADSYEVNTTELPEVEQENVDSHEENYDSEEPKLHENRFIEPVLQSQEDDTVDLNDLTQFVTYDDYIRAYCKSNLSFEDLAEILVNYHHGVLPPNMLTEKEFIDKKRKQVENIKYKELETKAAELRKKQIDTEYKLSAAREYLKLLERQSKEQENSLSENREKMKKLEKKISDADSKIGTLTRQNNDLTEQVANRDASINSQQSQIFKLEKRNAKDAAEMKKAKELEKELRNSISEAGEREAAKDRQISELTKKVNNLETNLLAELNKLKPEDDLEETALEWASKKEEEKEVKKPKHLSDKPRPAHLKQSANPEHMKPAHLKEESVESEEISNDKAELEEARAKLVNLLNNEIENTEEKKTTRKK